MNKKNWLTLAIVVIVVLVGWYYWSNQPAEAPAPLEDETGLFEETGAFEGALVIEAFKPYPNGQPDLRFSRPTPCNQACYDGIRAKETEAKAKLNAAGFKLVVTAPKPGETIKPGSNYAISWSSGGNYQGKAFEPTKVSIGLYESPSTVCKSGQVQCRQINNFGWVAYGVDNTGSYNWKVGEFFNPSFTQGGFRIWNFKADRQYFFVVYAYNPSYARAFVPGLPLFGFRAASGYVKIN